MLLIKKNKLKIDHVSFDTIEEFEQSILQSDPSVKEANSVFEYLFLPVYYSDKIYKGITHHSIINKLWHKVALKSKTNDADEPYFTVLMGMDFNKYYPYALFSKRKKYIYTFDTWTKNFQFFIDFINNYKIDKVFVSSSQAAGELNKTLGREIAFWIPEGIRPSEYKYAGYEEKNIDVLNFGRRYELYHNKILPYFETSSKTYLYEKVKGEVVFPTREDFIEGISKAKISICFPSSVTHPERAGSTETLTIRYLQSIISKCLIVGHAPKEMIDIFGYNPVIEADVDDPIKQIDEILTNYDSYIPLIERNYEEVLKNHTWVNRWQAIKSVLNK